MSTKYDVALSFAAEDRSVARQIAEALKQQNINVFFDSHSSAELWGRNLYEYLSNIYTQTKLCIVLISKNYNEKQWTTLEWRSLLARSARHPSFAILPIRLDRSELPQDVANLGYITWKPESLQKLTNTVKSILARHEAPTPTSEPEIFHIIKRERGWSVKREGASRATSIHKTQKQAIERARKLARRTDDSSIVVHTEDGSIKSHERL